MIVSMQEWTQCKHPYSLTIKRCSSTSAFLKEMDRLNLIITTNTICSVNLLRSLSILTSVEYSKVLYCLKNYNQVIMEIEAFLVFLTFFVLNILTT